MAKKCAPCTPAALVAAEFAHAKKTAKKAGTCQPMRDALEKLKPLVGVAAERNPRAARFLYRGLLSKEQQTQKACVSIAKAHREMWSGASHDSSWADAGMNGLRRRARRRRRR